MKNKLIGTIGRALELVSKTQTGFIGVQHATIVMQRHQLDITNKMIADTKRMASERMGEMQAQLTKARLEVDRLRKEVVASNAEAAEAYASLSDAEKQQAEAYAALSFDSDPLGETLTDKARRRMREHYEYKSNPLHVVRRPVDGSCQSYARDFVLRAIQRTWELSNENACRTEGRNAAYVGTHEADQMIDLALKAENGSNFGLPASLVQLPEPAPEPAPARSESLITTSERP